MPWYHSLRTMLSRALIPFWYTFWYTILTLIWTLICIIKVWNICNIWKESLVFDMNKGMCCTDNSGYLVPVLNIQEQQDQSQRRKTMLISHGFGDGSNLKTLRKFLSKTLLLCCFHAYFLDHLSHFLLVSFWCRRYIFEDKSFQRRRGWCKHGRATG